MRLTLKDDLPFTRLTVAYRGSAITVDNVLIDTGSASTVLAARAVAQIGIVPEMTDVVYTVRGIGGTEAVFTRRIDHVAVEAQRVTDFEIEVGSMNYGFDIDGILGMDFLTRAGAIINLRDLRLDFAP
jgi:predicted aspartyl protease